MDAERQDLGKRARSGCSTDREGRAGGKGGRSESAQHTARSLPKRRPCGGHGVSQALAVDRAQAGRHNAAGEVAGVHCLMPLQSTCDTAHAQRPQLHIRLAFGRAVTAPASHALRPRPYAAFPRRMESMGGMFYLA